MKLLIIVGCLLGNIAYAQNSIDDIKVSKDEIVKSLDMLKKSGSISEEDYQKAKKELGTMNDKQVDAITLKAKDTIKKNPSAAEGIGKDKLGPNADLDGLKKQFDNISK